MEQKTMGKFLAALRKANGYTQRELAEKLNVSDKAVSRWERDESAPDLSLLPVLAEIYGVTIEELIRGERLNGEKSEAKSKEKTEKLYRHLREKALLKYRNKTLIAWGIACAGFFQALVVNFFLRGARLGFCTGVIFYLVAVIAELIFTNEMFFTLDHMEGQQSENKQAKYRVLLCAEKMLTMTIFFVAFTAGLVTQSTKNAMAVDLRFFLKYGGCYGAIVMVICVALCYFGNEYLLRRGFYELEEKKFAIHRQLFWKRPLIAGILAVLIGGTFLVQRNLTESWTEKAGAQGIVMEEFADFREFVKQENYDSSIEYNTSEDTTAEKTEEYSVAKDQYGNAFAIGTGELQRIYDKNGKILYSFYLNNTSVVKWEYGNSEKLLPITVYTRENIQAAEQRIRQINAQLHLIFGIIYIAGGAGCGGTVPALEKENMAKELTELEKHYNKFNEEKRLGRRHGQVEYRITMEYIHRYLKEMEQPKILDVGAGTGRYAVALANEGYDVTAVELVKYNLGILKSKGSSVKAYQGNALKLSRFADESFDVTLLLGPMYHLYTFEDKVKALNEAKRVTKKGGIIFVAYLMNDYGVLMYGFKEHMVKECLSDGRLTEDFHCVSSEKDLYEYVTLKDIDQIKEATELKREKIIAPDGAANYMRPVLKEMDEETFELFVKYQLSVAERMDLMGASAHTVDILRV